MGSAGQIEAWGATGHSVERVRTPTAHWGRPPPPPTHPPHPVSRLAPGHVVVLYIQLVTDELVVKGVGRQCAPGGVGLVDQRQHLDRVHDRHRQLFGHAQLGRQVGLRRSAGGGWGGLLAGVRARRVPSPPAHASCQPQPLGPPLLLACRGATTRSRSRSAGYAAHHRTRRRRQASGASRMVLHSRGMSTPAAARSPSSGDCAAASAAAARSGVPNR